MTIVTRRPYHYNNSMASSTANCVNIRDEESRSHTNFEVTKFSHTWTISNLSFSEQRVGHCLPSATFPLRSDGQNNSTEWCLKLYPKGDNEDSKDYLSVYLCLLATKKSEVKAMMEIGIINAQGARHTIISSPEVYNFRTKTQFGWTQFVHQDCAFNNANGLTQDDKLVLFCEVKVLTNVSKTSEKLNVIPFTEPTHHLLANIGHLFETKKFSDVTLTACGKEFQAHKNILAAQSPVFSAMFDHDMSEKKQSRVDIIDIDSEVLQEMLLFLYTGKVQNMQKNAAGLLAAADKYSLENLKIMCEEALRASLTIENAADTLILADLHSAGHLKPQVISFIRFYIADVITTAGFKLLFLSHPSLFTEAFQNGKSCEVSHTDAVGSKLNACAKNTL